MSWIPQIGLPNVIFGNPVIATVLPVVVGVALSLTLRPADSDRIYRAIRFPPYTLPLKLNAPFWITVYSLSGYSAYRAWTTGSTSLDPQIRILTKQGATLWVVSYALKVSWVPLFLRFQRVIESSISMISLTIVTSMILNTWGQVDSMIRWTLVPEICWAAYSSYINFGFAALNNWTIVGKEKFVPPTSTLKKS